MIPELFLSCALSLPASFSGHLPELPDKNDLSILRMLSSFYQRGPYGDLPESLNRDPGSSRMVVVSDHWDLVGPLRRMGLYAWQLSRFVGMSQWFIQGEIEHSPIRDGAFHIVWALEPLRNINHIFPLVRMVRMWGFLIVDLPRGDGQYLIEEGFQRFPFEWQNYEIWRRSKKPGPHSPDEPPLLVAG